jgi:hypothetical protein
VDNIQLTYSPDKTKLVLTIDLTQEVGPSSSGKTTLIASTGPAVKVEGLNGAQLLLGLNLYRKK